MAEKTPTTPTPTGGAKPLSDAVKQALNQKPLGDQLDDAAGALLKQLPDHLIELFDSICKEYSLPRWQLVCGILLDVYMQGNLTAFTRDPDWDIGGKGKVVPKCGECGKEFVPKRLGEKFCSTDCGTKAEIKQKTLVPGVTALRVATEPGDEDALLHRAVVGGGPGVGDGAVGRGADSGSGWG